MAAAPPGPGVGVGRTGAPSAWSDARDACPISAETGVRFSLDEPGPPAPALASTSDSSSGSGPEGQGGDALGAAAAQAGGAPGAAPPPPRALLGPDGKLQLGSMMTSPQRPAKRSASFLARMGSSTAPKPPQPSVLAEQLQLLREAALAGDAARLQQLLDQVGGQGGPAAPARQGAGRRGEFEGEQGVGGALGGRC